MKLSKILVLVMTFAMLMSAFTPTLAVFAEELNSLEQPVETEKETLNYVSIGDSMANGYGFEGYLQGEAGHRFYEGFGTYGAGAYPLQFEEYLIEQGYDVNHTKLALSAMTPEYLLYLLGGREAYDNAWHDGVRDYGSDGTGKLDFDEMSAYYKEAVAGADVITLGVGNGNLGAFLLSEVTTAIGIMGSAPNPNKNYTLENALAVVENEREKELVLNVYNSVIEDMKPQMDAMGEEYGLTTIEQIAGIFAYSAAGIVFNYSRILEKIDELNEKESLDIIIVALMNTTYGMQVELENGEIFDFGGLMDEVFGLMNAYLSMYPAAMKTMGEFESINFTYAKQPQPKYILQAFDELQAANWTNVDFGDGWIGVECGKEGCGEEGHDCSETGRLSADIVRARTIKSYNERLRVMIGGAMGMNLSEITLDDVKAWKEWGDEVKQTVAQVYSAPVEYITDDYMQAAFVCMRPDILMTQGQEASAAMTTSVAIYLAIEDAIVNSINEKTIKVEDALKIANVEQLMTVFNGIDREESDKSPYHVRQVIGDHLSKEDIIPLVNIYAIFQIGDGMCVHPTPEGHDDITAEIIDAYESGKSVDKDDILKIYDYILEYYDVIYKYAYEYVDAEGYIDRSLEPIDEVLNVLNAALVEIESIPAITEELKAQLRAELNAAIATVEELKAAIVSDKIGTVDGIVATALDLEDDLRTHVTNVSSILAQAGYDVETLLVPALMDAHKVLVNEVVPELFVMAENFAFAAVDFTLSNLDTIYYNFPEIVNTAYSEAVKVIVMLQIVVGDAIEVTADVIVNAYNKVMAVATDIYDDLDEAYAFTKTLIISVVGTLIQINENTDGLLEDMFAETFGITVDEIVTYVSSLYDETSGNVQEMLEQLNALLMGASDKIEGEMPTAIALYNVILNVLADSYGNTEDALVVAGQIFSYVADFVVENDMGGNLKGHLDNIVDLIAETYRGTKDVEKVGAEIYAYVLAMFDDTFYADYQLTADSLYVSLGNATYGEELAEMLHLGDKYHNFALDDDYLDTLADADFVTIRIDNGEIVEFAMNQVMNYGEELDWDKYLDANGQAALENVLVSIEAAFLDSGMAAEMAVVIENLILEELGGYELDISLNDELVAGVLAYSVESLIYAYAETIERLEVTLDNVYTVAPNATVVITGVQNSLAELGLEELGLDLSGYEDAINAVIATFNAQLVAVAYANENTIYVDSVDAAAIYAALNVTCQHVYTDCEDTTCDLCGETRVAPGHTYGEWKVVTEATVDAEGCEERECTVCHHKETRSIPKISMPEKDVPKVDEPKNNTALVIGIIVGVVVLGIAGITYYKKKKAPASATDEEKPSPDKE